MRSFIAGLALSAAVLLAAPVIAQSPVPCSTASPAGVPVTITGGSQNEAATAAFDLAPGDYLLVLDGEAAEKSNVILKMPGPGIPEYDNIWNEVEGPGAYRLETYLYGVEGGRYHFEYNLPRGSWTVTVTPA